MSGLPREFRLRPARPVASYEQRRANARERGYDSRWAKARIAFLVDNPLCVMCGSPATVVDHRQPHEGDMRLFWDRDNWQPLCKSCHDGPKQRSDRRRR